MRPLRIILVEDDAMIGFLLAEMLAGMGHHVCAVETTEAGAIRAAFQHKPDLMIVDVHLADGTGISAMATITQAGPMPHLFISAERVQAPWPKAVMLRKPFWEAELVDAIARTLSPMGAPQARV